MEVVFVEPPHPALLDADPLLALCELRTQRRSGPGGQHRNKTSSGVFLTATPWDITAEATERRSQSQNRIVALTRLRYRLAMELRTPSIFDAPPSPEESQVREQYKGHSLRMNDENRAKPIVLALILNDLHASGGHMRATADAWSCSSTALVNLLKSHPSAFIFANTLREFHGLKLLKT